MNREELLSEILKELKSYPQVNLIAEGGAKAFNRYDELSDIDLMVDAEDGTIEETVKMFENFMNEIAGISLVYIVTEKKDNQHKFYKLKGTDKFSIVDLFIVERSNPAKELEKHIHGNFVVHYDRYGYMNEQKFDKELFQEKINAFDLKSKNVFGFFQYQIEKEIIRGRYIDALAYYFDLTLKPLIRSLRIKYNPVHYNFEFRYLYDEFPVNIVKEIEALLSIRDIDDLKKKHKMAIDIYNREFGENCL